MLAYISKTMLRILSKFATFKVAVSIINFDKLSHRYDDLYLDVTRGGTRYEKLGGRKIFAAAIPLFQFAPLVGGHAFVPPPPL